MSKGAANLNIANWTKAWYLSASLVPTETVVSNSWSQRNVVIFVRICTDSVAWHWCCLTTDYSFTDISRSKLLFCPILMALWPWPAKHMIFLSASAVPLLYWSLYQHNISMLAVPLQSYWFWAFSCCTTSHIISDTVMRFLTLCGSCRSFLYP